MKIAAIVDIRGEYKCQIITMPHVSDEDKLFELVDKKVKRDIDSDGLVVDIYTKIGYATISFHEYKIQNYKIGEKIVDCVCQALELNYDKMVSPGRYRKYADGRSIAAYYINQTCDLTLNEIGEFLGGRHHSTVINMMKRYSQLAQVDYDFQEKVEKVEHLLKIKHHVDI